MAAFHSEADIRLNFPKRSASDPKRTSRHFFRMLASMVNIKSIASRGRLVGEFVLVVLGVLVALMVDTWIEQRNDDNLGQEYLARLADDLEADRQSLDYRIAFFTAVHSFGIQTLDRLQSDRPVDQDALLAAYYASENFGFRPIENTYEDLQSTGNIRLLGDIELRLALASYHRKTSTYLLALSETYREIVRGIIPWNIQQGIREHCPTTDDIGEIPTGFPPCTIPGVSVDDANVVFTSLRAHPGIFEILTYRISDVEVGIFLFEAQKETVLDVLEQLENKQ